MESTRFAPKHVAWYQEIARFTLDALIFSDDPEPDLVDTARELAEKVPRVLSNSDQETVWLARTEPSGHYFILQRKIDDQISGLSDTRAGRLAQRAQGISKAKIDGLIQCHTVEIGTG